MDASSGPRPSGHVIMFRQLFSSRRALSLFTLLTWLALPVAWWAAGRAVPRSIIRLHSPADRVWLNGPIDGDNTLLEEYDCRLPMIILRELTTGKERAVIPADMPHSPPRFVLRPNGSVLAAIAKQ